MAIAFRTPGLVMLEGRSDLAVLWDLRVSPHARRRGVGTALFAAAAAWATDRGCRHLKVETQNINVPACRFYVRQGCTLGAIHRFAYPELPGEVQLLWYKQLLDSDSSSSHDEGRPRTARPGAAPGETIARPSRALELDLLPERFGVARLDAASPIPAWAESSSFASFTRTPHELSVVCLESRIPDSATAERGLRCLAVRGPLSFSETGILASLATPLAAAQVSIFAVSTHDTDYLLVPGASLEIALHALREAGHGVWQPE